VTIEITVLLILVTVYLLQRLVRSGFVRHRVRRQWRVAWAHVRRAPFWALGAGALLTVVSLAARALILPALAWGMPHAPPFAQMFFGALALLHAPLVVRSRRGAADSRWLSSTGSPGISAPAR